MAAACTIFVPLVTGASAACQLYCAALGATGLVSKTMNGGARLDSAVISLVPTTTADQLAGKVISDSAGTPSASAWKFNTRR